MQLAVHELGVGFLLVLSDTVPWQWISDSDIGLSVLLFSPFTDLAQSMIDVFVDALTHKVNLNENSAVESIHQLTLMVSVPGAVLVAAAAGLYPVSEELGLSRGNVWRILSRLVIGLGIAAVALPVLQVLIDLADVLVEVFRPQDTLKIEQLAGLSAGLVLVVFVNAWLLLALVILFVIRNVYLLFVPAVAPLIALGWALPHTRPYAESFTSIWFALLAVAPADVLVLRFSLALLDMGEALGADPVSNWVLGISSFALMLWIPYQLISISQGVVYSRGFAGRIGGSWRGRGGKGGGGSGGDRGGDEGRQRRRDRDRRRRR